MSVLEECRLWVLLVGR
ncbi:hypothetical protein LINPERPRIM_LOCUS21070 [Linum perenne]